MEERLCGRVGCGEPAICVLLIAPQERQAWLVAVDHESAPEGVALCERHADRISVPVGWGLTNERPAKPARRRRRKAPAKPIPVEEPTDTGSADPAAADTDGHPSAPADQAKAPSKPRPAPARRTKADKPKPPAPEPLAEPVVDPTIQLPVIEVEDERPPRQASSPSDVPGVAADTASDMARSGSSPRLSVVQGTTEPAVPDTADAVAESTPADPAAPSAGEAPSGQATTPATGFDFEDDGQGALWTGPPDLDPDQLEATDRTPLLKRAFRVVRED